MNGTIDNKKYAMLLAETLSGIIETEEENERAVETVQRFVQRLMKKAKGICRPKIHRSLACSCA